MSGITTLLEPNNGMRAHCDSAPRERKCRNIGHAAARTEKA
jgi:hypothetical protein